MDFENQLNLDFVKNFKQYYTIENSVDTNGDLFMNGIKCKQTTYETPYKIRSDAAEYKHNDTLNINERILVDVQPTKTTTSLNITYINLETTTSLSPTYINIQTKTSLGPTNINLETNTSLGPTDINLETTT